LLPDWANPYKLTEHDICREDSNPQPTDLSSYLRAIAQQLRVKEKPSVDLVVNHVTHLCAPRDPNAPGSSENSEEFNAFVRMEAMKRVYQYLQV